ncbi:DUF7504 family protein [Haladaptatus sp. NG-WS-4]
MDCLGERSESGDAGYQAFTAHLAALKQEGSALLVVGNLPPAEYRHACHDMLGDDSATRRRILVTTDHSTSTPEARLPPGQRNPQADTVSHITYATQSRSTAVQTTASTVGLPTKRIDEPDLSTLGVTISEAVDEFQRITPELAPAELRVCFDSLRPLISEHDTETVFQFLHLLTERIRAVRGMGHFHLAVATGSETVRIFATLFDAVVELRSNGETIQQRWCFPDRNMKSSWLTV